MSFGESGRKFNGKKGHSGKGKSKDVVVEPFEVFEREKTEEEVSKILKGEITNNQITMSNLRNLHGEITKVLAKKNIRKEVIGLWVKCVYLASKKNKENGEIIFGKKINETFKKIVDERDESKIRTYLENLKLIFEAYFAKMKMEGKR